MPEKESADSWHLNKSVSITQIIAIIGLLGALVLQWNTLDKRLAVVETNQTNNNTRILQILENQAVIDQRQDVEIQRLREETRSDYRSIDDKLDRLIEREL